MTEMQELAERLRACSRCGSNELSFMCPGGEWHVECCECGLISSVSVSSPDTATDAWELRQMREAILTLERERDEAREANAALMRERAELVKTKHEQIARLTAERDEWEKACDGNTALGAEVAEVLTARATAAAAQVQALREALEKIEAMPSTGAAVGFYGNERVHSMQEMRLNEQCRMIARAALRSEP